MAVITKHLRPGHFMPYKKKLSTGLIELFVKRRRVNSAETKHIDRK